MSSESFIQTAGEDLMATTHSGEGSGGTGSADGESELEGSS